MLAYTINEFGDYTVLKLSQIEIPQVKSGHVLVKISASSVNQIDIKIRSGAVPEIAPQFPAVLGADIAGVVVKLGVGVTEFALGDEVYGFVGGVKGCGGALAEYILADVRLLAHKPQHLSMQQAASLPLVAQTAYDALFGMDKNLLLAGKSVLIHGGLGGVGHVALQLAKTTGASVFTTVAEDQDFDLAQHLGANHVINYNTTAVADYVQRYTDNKGFDVIFDTVGGANLNNSLQAAANYASVITTAARVQVDLSPMHNKALSLRAVFVLLSLLTSEHRDRQQRLFGNLNKLISAKKVLPLIADKQFGFTEAAAAHRYLQSGQAKGKVVIDYQDV